jgi:hypothetical protein
VGYGDYYPITLMGQSLAFFIFILGTFFISLCFILLVTSLEMNHKERNALSLINKLNLNEQVKQHSALAITSFFKLITDYKKKKSKGTIVKDDQMIKTNVINMLSSLKIISSLRNKKKNYMQNDLLKNMIDNNDYSSFYLKELNNKQIFLLSKLIQIKESIQLARRSNRHYH